MNELRWILLGIGILIIVGIYFIEKLRRKQGLRSRVDKYPAFNHEGISSVRIKPEKDKNIDISGALTALNTYLMRSRDTLDKTTESLQLNNEINGSTSEQVAEDVEHLSELPKKSNQQIFVIYITSRNSQGFAGKDIYAAMQTSEMQYGDMDIFHYHGPAKKKSDKALFSIADIHEPGTFDIKHLDTMSTDGLAVFMCLPTDIGGDIAFEIMLDTAQYLARQLGGELRGVDKNILDNDNLTKMRELASQF